MIVKWLLDYGFDNVDNDGVTFVKNVKNEDGNSVTAGSSSGSWVVKSSRIVKRVSCDSARSSIATTCSKDSRGVSTDGLSCSLEQ